MQRAARKVKGQGGLLILLDADDDLSFAEVGTLLGCSDDAAKMLYRRALRALREMLTE